MSHAAPASDRNGWTRRALLGAAAGVIGSIAWRRAEASPEELAAAVRAFAGGAPLRTGRVLLDIAPLVENGNAVPIRVTVDSPMNATSSVQEIVVFNQRNPQRDVAVFRMGPRAGRATVSTRIRLATSQQIVAVAQMSDGSCFTHTVDVIVTLAACIET